MEKHPELESNPSRVNSVLSKIVPRKQRKIIERSKDLRNALIHYDFFKLLGEESCKDNDVETILNLATESTVKMTSREYLDWLRNSNEEIAAYIASVVMLPN